MNRFVEMEGTMKAGRENIKFHLGAAFSVCSA